MRILLFVLAFRQSRPVSVRYELRGWGGLLHCMISLFKLWSFLVVMKVSANGFVSNHMFVDMFPNYPAASRSINIIKIPPKLAILWSSDLIVIYFLILHRGNTKICSGTYEAEGPYFGSCEESFAGGNTILTYSLLFYTFVMFFLLALCCV